MANAQDISCGKMSPEPSPQTKAKTSNASSKQSAKSKTISFLFLNAKSGSPQERSWETITPSLGECLTRSIGEFPKEENASTLSQILESGVPEKYYLTPKACQGILRRASARGKELPDVLKKALIRQASA